MSAPPIAVGVPMTILVTREAFSDYFVLTLPNGFSEELEFEETRQWFKDHGGDMDAVEKCLDHVYNFRQAEITIRNFRVPHEFMHPHAPKLG